MFTVITEVEDYDLDTDNALIATYDAWGEVTDRRSVGAVPTHEDAVQVHPELCLLADAFAHLAECAGLVPDDNRTIAHLYQNSRGAALEAAEATLRTAACMSMDMTSKQLHRQDRLTGWASDIRSESRVPWVCKAHADAVDAAVRRRARTVPLPV